MADHSIQYYFHRGAYPSVAAAAIGAPAAVLPTFLGRHHILSYPRMYALGAIVLSAFKLDPTLCSKYLNQLSTYYIAGMTPSDIVTGVCLQGRTIIIRTDKTKISNFLNRFAWNDNNLFVGPAPQFRNDDPRQGVDMIPLSMKKTAFVKALPDLFSRHGGSAIPCEEGEGGPTKAITMSDELIVSIADELCQKHPRQATLYYTQVEDWLAYIDKKYYKLYIDTPSAAGSKKKQNLQNSLKKAKLVVRGSQRLEKEVFRATQRHNSSDPYTVSGYFVREGPEHDAQQENKICPLFSNLPQT